MRLFIQWLATEDILDDWLQAVLDTLPYTRIFFNMDMRLRAELLEIVPVNAFISERQRSDNTQVHNIVSLIHSINNKKGIHSRLGLAAGWKSVRKPDNRWHLHSWNDIIRAFVRTEVLTTAKHINTVRLRTLLNP